MNHRLGMAITCLRISTILYVVLSIFLAFYLFTGPADPAAAPSARYLLGLMVLLCLSMAIVPETAIVGIKRRRSWGWVLGLIIFGLYLPSLFFPLGAVGLWGLLDSGSRAEMGIGSAAPAALGNQP